MSVHVTSWVLKHSNAEGTQRAVLLVLADHAHADGTNATVSIDRIRFEARRKSDRAVSNALNQLVADGRVIRERGKGVKTATGATNRYAVVMDQVLEKGLAPDWVRELHGRFAGSRGAESAPLNQGAHPDAERGADSDIKGRTDERQGAHQDAPEPSVEPTPKPLVEPPDARARGLIPPELTSVTDRLIRVVEAKKAKPLKIELVVRYCAQFGRLDLGDEAQAFEHYWLHGVGEDRGLRDVAAGWRNWLSNSLKRVAGGERAGPGPGQHPAERRIREVRDRQQRRGEAA